MSTKKLLTIQNRRFIDSDGRQVLLHGINLVNKDPKTGYLGGEGPEFFDQLRQWGFNCLRLGVIWDGLEPHPGQYNEVYLRGLDQQIELAARNNLCVFLDMHQDLFSVRYSDGAPEWATLTGGTEHITSGIWSDAYFTSPAVQAALDSFWENAPAPDGVGIQDHYARAWGVLAQRYASCSNVIGCDLMNEPFPGALALQIQAAMFTKGAELLSGVDFSGFEGVTETVDFFPQGEPAEMLAQMWLTAEGRSRILALLDDMDIYTQVIDATQALYNEFERDKLMGLYRRAAREIRAVDSHSMLFLETTMGSNMGVFSALEPLTLQEGGRDPHQVYAAHGYDLVTDTAGLAQPSNQRIELIFQRHEQTSRWLNMPMLVGEWGAYGDMPGTLPAARQVVSLFEDLLCSETYWAFIPGIENTDSFPAIHRPYPQRVSGELLHYRFLASEQRFTCSWQEDGANTAQTYIFLPDWFNSLSRTVSLSPHGGGFQMIPVTPGSANVILEIPPVGETTERHLEIR